MAASLCCRAYRSYHFSEEPVGFPFSTVVNPPCHPAVFAGDLVLDGGESSTSVDALEVGDGCAGSGRDAAVFLCGDVFDIFGLLGCGCILE